MSSEKNESTKMFNFFHHINAQMTTEDINKAIEKGVRGRAAGIVGLNKKILFSITEIIVSLTLNLLRKCTGMQDVPALWKSTRLKMLRKKKIHLILITIDQFASFHTLEKYSKQF